MPRRAEEEPRDDEEKDEEARLAEDDEQDEDARAEDDMEDSEEDDDESDDGEEAMDDEECEDDEEPEQEPESRRARRSKKSKARARAPRSLQQLAGLPPGSSNPAIISALYPLVSMARTIMAETDSPTAAAALGAFRAISEDAAKAGELQSKLRVERKRNNRRERMSLLRKLQKANIHPRGELFVDVIDDQTGERKVKAAPIWAEMKLGTLRQYVKTKLKSSVPRKRPAQPDGESFDAFSAGGGGSAGVTAEDRRIAEKHGYDPKDVAASRNALFNKRGA